MCRDYHINYFKSVAYPAFFPGGVPTPKIAYLALWEPFTTLLDKGRVSRHKKVGITRLYI